MKRSKHIAVDLEFNNNILCLIQVAWGEGKEDGVLIDYLALHKNKTREKRHALGPFVSILKSRAITKVFHAPSQDLKILYRLTGQFPANIADTQLMYAATTSDLTHSPGYAHVVGDLLDIHLDKTEQQSDWTQRPLSAHQLDYASADVSHLYVLYPLLQERLQKMERSKLIEEVFNERFQVGNLIQESKRKLRLLLNRVKDLSDSQAEQLTSLANWRRQQLPKRGRKFSQLLSDQNLIAIVQNPKLLNQGRFKSVQTPLLAVLDSSAALSVYDLPAEFIPAKNLFETKLMELLREKAHVEHIPQFLVGSRKTITGAMLGRDLSILKGERGKLLGYKINFLIQQYQQNPERSLALNQFHKLLLEDPGKVELLDKQLSQVNDENINPQVGKKTKL